MKFLRTDFFVERLTVQCTFSKFYVMNEFFGRLWVQKLHFLYFLWHCFDFLHGCLTPKFLESVSFARITTSAPALF